jgi:uncharacterized protein (DUF58 family)
MADDPRTLRPAGRAAHRLVSARPDEARLRDIRARARGAAALLRLPFGRRTWTGPAGGWAGGGRGTSLEFQDHREYAPGDDPRHINWQAFARSDSYTMKVYREEVSPVADLLLDTSASMFQGEDKRDRTLEAFCFAAESAQAAGAALRAFAVSGSGCQPLDPALRVVPELGARGAARAPALLALPLRPGGLRVLVSDCLFGGPPAALLSVLTARGGRAVLLAPYSAAEATPAWDGETDFEDCESGERIQQRVGDVTRARYQIAYRRHFEGWSAECARWRVAFARLPSDVPLLEALRREALPADAVEPLA